MKYHALPSRKGTLVPFLATALAAAALTACGSEKADPVKDQPAPHNTAGAPTNAMPMNNPTSANPANTPAQTAVNAAPAAPAPGPNGRSTVPTMAEWTAQTKEVGVKGSTKLNCETKMVREWLRISCRGKNDTGGEPKSVTITKGGGRGDTFTFASGGVASLVCPYVDGTDLAAQFEWTDKKMELVVSWPHGAPEPPLKGEFR